eukprot:2960151-Pyramimonas_sp.AAC.1
MSVLSPSTKEAGSVVGVGRFSTLDTTGCFSRSRSAIYHTAHYTSAAASATPGMACGTRTIHKQLGPGRLDSPIHECDQVVGHQGKIRVKRMDWGSLRVWTMEGL